MKELYSKHESKSLVFFLTVRGGLHKLVCESITNLTPIEHSKLISQNSRSQFDL